MPFELPELPYDHAALEPHIDARTMEIHHGKHHATYVTNLNAALEGTEWADRSLDSILADLDLLPEDKRMAVRNNGGGHANHSLFWQIMSPDGGGDPEGELGQAIADTFGSADELRAAVNDAGVKRFGSGWTWLVWDGKGLAVMSTPNQDAPVMDGDVALLGIDVWEHAYYLNYQNRRPDYLAAWWNVVNWDEVGRRYAEAQAASRNMDSVVVGGVEIVPVLDAVGDLCELTRRVPRRAEQTLESLTVCSTPSCSRGRNGACRWPFISFARKERRSLVDTGVGPAGLWDFWAPEHEGLLPEELERLGVHRDAVDVVFLTHFHVDHLGWNTDEEL